MSSLIVSVATMSDIRPHSNADTLDIAEVLGWQVVIKRGSFAAGDKVLYFAPDCVLTKELSDAWGVTQYLDRGRIKATRLRGEPSFGLVMPCTVVDWEVGQNVAEWFPDVSKWEPPTRESRGGHAIPNEHSIPRHPLFTQYTDIENLRHYPDLFGEDELVVVTEKIHGTNSRIGLLDGEWVAGSHRVQRGPGDDLYWGPKPIVERLLSSLGKRHKQVEIFGEIFGDGVQSLDYGVKGHAGYRAFDLYLDGRYLDWATFEILCFEFDVPTVPVLDFGAYSLDCVRHEAIGETTLKSASHLREGVVVRPLAERHDRKVGRVILKYVSDEYLLAKKTDFKEE